MSPVTVIVSEVSLTLYTYFNKFPENFVFNFSFSINSNSAIASVDDGIKSAVLYSVFPIAPLSTKLGKSNSPVFNNMK